MVKMFGFINQIFITLLGFCGSLTTKCISLNNEPSKARSTLTYLTTRPMPIYDLDRFR